MTSAIAHGAERSQPQRIELEVSGMTCAACANRVQRALNTVDGVRASVNFVTRVATIDAIDTVGAQALCDVVQQAGYRAERRRRHAPWADDPEADRAHDLLCRLAVAAVLFVLLAALSVTLAVVPGTRLTGCGWLLVVPAAPIVTWAAWPFHRVAATNLRHGNASMETLISIGITAATVWSLYTIFFNSHARAPAGVATSSR